MFFFFLFFFCGVLISLHAVMQEVVDAVNDVLDVTLYDKDTIGKNEFLGAVAVPVAIVTNAGKPIDQEFKLLDKFAASETHSKVERGTIRLRLIWTDDKGVAWDGSQAAAAAPAAGSADAAVAAAQAQAQQALMLAQLQAAQMNEQVLKEHLQRQQAQLLALQATQAAQAAGAPPTASPVVFGTPMAAPPPAYVATGPALGAYPGAAPAAAGGAAFKGKAPKSKQPKAKGGKEKFKGGKDKGKFKK